MKTLSFAGLVLGLVSAPAFGTVLIDNFNDAQFFGVGPAGGNPLSASQSVVTSANSIGGGRSVIFTRTSGNSFDFVNVAAGIYEHNLGAGDAGLSQIIWDGDTNPALNQNGYSIDLTESGVNTLLRLQLRSDLLAPISITVYSGAGNFSTTVFNTPAQGFIAPFTEYYLPFSGFIVGGGTGANFANVTAITALIDGRLRPGVDVQMDVLYADKAPEPATLGLAGIVLTAIAVVSRRRKA